MTEPIDVLSGSSLNTFLRCQKQWELLYVYRFRAPPKLRMIRGTAGHYAAEVDMKAKLQTQEDLPLDDVLDAYSTSFDLESVEADDDDKETKAMAKDVGVASVKLWRDKVAPTIFPLMVEEPISFVINGNPWTGTIDLVDDDFIVRDWKFTGRTPSNADSYILNMVGYAIGYRQKTGRIENQVVLDHMVSLKTPKHVAIKSDGPVPDQSIVAFANIVDDAKRSIEAGIFPPTGLKSGACSWCGVRNRCPAWSASPMGRAKERKEDLEMDLKRSLVVIEGGQ